MTQQQTPTVTWDVDDLNWVPWGNPTHQPGFYRAVVVLREDETAWNPASTKRVIYGPATVTYEKYPSGIDAHVGPVK